MKTIKITVESEEAAQSVIDIVSELDFVTFIGSVEDNKPVETPRGSFSSENEFLSMCGLWKDRDISAKEIREQAWRKFNR